MNKDKIELQIKDKNLTAPRITPEHIESIIGSVNYFTGKEGVLGAYKSSNDQTVSKNASIVGLKAAFNIMDKWGCTAEQQRHILGMKKSTFYKHSENPSKASLSVDQVERISYLLNIHSALRVVFDNPVNVYGFMSMKNANSFFNGKSPIDVISTGNFGYLYEAFKHIDALRGGGW